MSADDRTKVRNAIADVLKEIKMLEDALCTKDQPQDALPTKINEYIESLARLSSVKDCLAANGRPIEVPLELIAAIDDGANPDSFINEVFIECRQANQISKGKVAGFIELREALSEKLTQEFPVTMEAFEAHKDT